MEVMSAYFHSLEECLDCPKPVRRPFLARTRQMAEDFFQNRPEATPEEAADYLGDPQELAQGFMETLDSSELGRYRKRKKLLQRGCVAVLAITLVVVSALFVWHLSLPLDAEITYSTIVYQESMEGAT